MPRGKHRPQATCHPERLHVARGKCGACYEKWRRANNPNVREHGRHRCKAFRERLKARDPEGARRRKKNEHLKSGYGIDLKTYERLLAAQGQRCAICGGGRGRRHLAVDHCHATGGIRGLLCSRCNVGLGQFQDNVSHLTKAINYLVRHGAGHVLSH